MIRIDARSVRLSRVFLIALSLWAIPSVGVLHAGILGQCSFNCRPRCIEVNVQPTCGTFSKCILRNIRCDVVCNVQRVKAFCESRSDCRDYVRECRDYDNDCTTYARRGSNNSARQTGNTRNGSRKGRGAPGGRLVNSKLGLGKQRLSSFLRGRNAYKNRGAERQQENNNQQASNRGTHNTSTQNASNQRPNNNYVVNNGTNGIKSHQPGNPGWSSSQKGPSSNNQNQQSTNNVSSNHNSSGPSLSNHSSNNGPVNRPASSNNSQQSNENWASHSSNNHGNNKGFTQSRIQQLPNHVLAFTVKANANTSVRIEGLSFDHKRNCFGPFSGAVVYSLDGFETVADRLCFDISECWQHEWWNFCDFVLNPCETAEFRFILKDALDWCYGTFCLDNVRITGCPIDDPPTSVPEPGSLAPAAMAIVIGAGSRYRSRRRKGEVAAL